MKPDLTPATDWKERIAPDEAKRFAGYARHFAAIQAEADAGKQVALAAYAFQFRSFKHAGVDRASDRGRRGRIVKAGV